MNMKKLKRYTITNFGDHCKYKDVTELEAINEELVKALEGVLELAVSHIDDSYTWDAEEAPRVIAARKALKSARGESK